ncbi:MAG: BatA domain-containing protein, partial [Lentisphaeraceae bacterium]|nr:BatA domain-containing protein [Lentisphaeraceae bacterium]
MIFLNSILLWSALGAAIPVIIHLLNREKPKLVEIPTVAFIIKAMEKSTGSSKLNNLFLLIVRTLILILITLIIARPQITRYMQLAKSQDRQTVIIVDNSFYSGHSKGGDMMLDDMKRVALRLIDDLPAGERICVLSSDEQSLGFTEIKSYVVDKVRSLSPSPQLMDCRSLISAALDLNDEKQGSVNTHVYVISDMNRGAWQDNYQFVAGAESIHVIPMAQRKGNVYIESVTLNQKAGNQLVYPNRMSSFKCRVRGDRTLSGLKVFFRVDDKIVDEKTLFIDEQEGEVDFEMTFRVAGTHFCSFSVESHDGIQEDNTFYYCVKVQAPPSIIILNDGGFPPLVYKMALAPAHWRQRQKFNVMLKSYNQLEQSLIDKPQILLLSGSMNLNEGQWDKLLAYANSGGGLLIVPDEDSRLTYLNKAALRLFDSNIKM